MNVSAPRVAALKSLGMRIATTPVRGVPTIGRFALLTAEVLALIVVDGIRMRLPAQEYCSQAWALFKVTAAPAVMMAVPFGAMVSVQTSGIINQVGASSLVGAASGIGVLRQGAPITAGLLMGGAAASAIGADLGARAIREELDAMRVMGVDPVRRMVVPRVLALLSIAPILCTLIIATAVMASFTLAVAVNDVTPGSFWNSFGAFASVVDMWFAIGKSMVFALLVAVIAALRGMDAKGGPRGVADAVNSSVVLSIIAIVLANLAITQVQTMFFPMELS
ncbi:MlaE family ABC transporter permease [Nocardia nepalensis]|uniref:MlaE family ABC transporter permease n=1 Tax=Nocardia nepalensis TaxID=3375448 RepID=UPI003B66B749